MKKQFVLLSSLIISGALSAQVYDAKTIDERLEKERIENNRKFELYWAGYNGANKNEKAKEELRSNIAGFIGNKPFFYTLNDTDQIANGNVDFLQNGQITGLTQALNGSGITIHVFDGGRVYANHLAFGGTATTPSTRIVNGEAATMAHSSHATNVTGMMGSISRPVSGTIGGNPVSGDIKGMAPEANFVAYSFRASTLPGNTAQSTVFQKIQLSQPTLSNHSYGTNNGWIIGTTAQGYPENGWYYTGNYVEADGTYQDLQGAYFSSDKNYDQLVKANPNMVIVKSSGNSFNMGPAGSTFPAYYDNGTTTTNWVKFTDTQVKPVNNCGTGYDCIGVGSLAKNIIVVGATEKITANGKRYIQASDVVKADYSSAGPRDDGGIKPDIAGVGSSIFSPSTADTVDGSQTYSYGNGTSFSAPQVTGIIGLWNEAHKTLFNNTLLNAATAKTLLVHSAAEAGTTTGPDAHFGWGFVDAKKGAELLVAKSNGSVIFNEETLVNNGQYTKEIQATQNGPLKVTISWVDPAYENYGTTYATVHNNRTSVIVNDLDLKVIDITDNTTHLPWKLDLNNLAGGAVRGDNTVDNVEQVVIDNAVAGRTYRIEVSHKRNLKDNAAQSFAILAEGNGGLLATKEVDTDKAIAIYPTLATDTVNVLTPNKAKISVYDTAGKLVRKIEGKGAVAIDVNNLTKGMYLVTIETDNTSVTKKFIKN